MPRVLVIVYEEPFGSNENIESQAMFACDSLIQISIYEKLVVTIVFTKGVRNPLCGLVQ